MYKRLTADFGVTPAHRALLAGAGALRTGASGTLLGAGIAATRNAFDKTSTEEEKNARLSRGLRTGLLAGAGLGAVSGGVVSPLISDAAMKRVQP